MSKKFEKHKLDHDSSWALSTAKNRAMVARIAAEEVGLPKTAVDAAQAATIGTVCGTQLEGRGGY